ncbi:Sm [Musa troglodytarum]|nr:Sm [Musa troglodytarum]
MVMDGPDVGIVRLQIEGNMKRILTGNSRYLKKAFGRREGIAEEESSVVLNGDASGVVAALSPPMADLSCQGSRTFSFRKREKKTPSKNQSNPLFRRETCWSLRSYDPGKSCSVDEKRWRQGERRINHGQSENYASTDAKERKEAIVI